MTQGERVKEIRKSLNLTLEKFGEKLGVKKGALSAIENGRNALTDQLAKSISREYNVNYDYLMHGEGEMFTQMTPDEEIANFFGNVLKDDDSFKKRLISGLANLDDNGWKVLEAFLKSISDTKEED